MHGELKVINSQTLSCIHNALIESVNQYAAAWIGQKPMTFYMAGDQANWDS